MRHVRATITRWVDDEPQPGIVELVLIDRHGREWRFVEKSAIPYYEYCDQLLDAESIYPQPGGIACELVARGRDADGRAFVAIDTERPWGVSSQEDVSRFEVFEDQIFVVPFGWPHRHSGEC